MTEVMPELVAYWADSRELLTYAERRQCLGDAKLESFSPTEILLRVPDSKRLIVVTSMRAGQVIFCSLCKADVGLMKKYGRRCPGFVHCQVPEAKQKKDG